MSDATTLIRKALDAGIELQFVDGQLKVTGKRKAVECWASKLRENKAALIEALQPPEPAAVDWRELDRAYQLHHINCPTCIAAGRGYGLRCGTGSVIWAAYSTATTSRAYPTPPQTEGRGRLDLKSSTCHETHCSPTQRINPTL